MPKKGRLGQFADLRRGGGGLVRKRGGGVFEGALIPQCTLCQKVLENYQKNVFSSVPFEKFKLSNPPTYNYLKTDSSTNISFVCFHNFKIGCRASVVESLFRKVTKTSGFCNFFEKSNTCMVYSEKQLF